MGADRQAAVAAETCGPISHHRRDHSVRDSTDPVVFSVRDVQVARGIHSYTEWHIEQGEIGRPIIAAEMIKPVSGFQPSATFKAPFCAHCQSVRA